MRHPFLDIPELQNMEAGRSIVRIPDERDVPFTPRVRAIVDTAEFQRLRHITQLGLASLVYPGATHTRFEHALGVFQNALRYLWQLGTDPRLGDILNQHHAEILIVSALLHDLGHWPFCHPIEDMALENLPPHEVFAKEFLSADSELTKVLSSEWDIQPDELLDLLIKRNHSHPFRLMQSILSGPIDIDKMDYLDRDSLHCGVPYGRNFDRNRLIQSLVLNESGDGLAISSKGKTAAEMMVFARYVMFSEVYWHHTVRAATSMFARCFYDLYQEIDLGSFFRQTEQETVRKLRQLSQGRESECLIEGIFGTRRVIYKQVMEFSIYQHPQLYARLAGKPYSKLVHTAKQSAILLSRESGESVSPTDMLIDAPPPDREVEFNVDIFFPKENVYRSLGDVSPVVSALAKEQFDDYVKRVRIFVNPQKVHLFQNTSQMNELINQAINSIPN